MLSRSEVRKFEDRIESELTALGFRYVEGDHRPWRAPTEFGCELRVDIGLGVSDVPRAFCDFDRPVGVAGEKTYADIAARLGNVNPYTGKCNEYCDGVKTSDQSWGIIRRHLLRCITTKPLPVEYTGAAFR